MIQHNETGLYLKDEESWTSELDKALLFDELADAENFCERFGLNDVSIAVTYRE